MTSSCPLARRLLASLLCLLLSQLAQARSAPAPLRVATYNLRHKNAGDGTNTWPNRKEMVKDLVRYYHFDVFGMQEVLRGQLTDLAELSDYAFMGPGRNDGHEAGEHLPIFYRRSRLQMLKTGDFWLSKTPHQPGKGWDATCCNRICTRAQFKDLETKQNFYFFQRAL